MKKLIFTFVGLSLVTTAAFAAPTAGRPTIEQARTAVQDRISATNLEGLLSESALKSLIPARLAESGALARRVSTAAVSRGAKLDIVESSIIKLSSIGEKIKAGQASNEVKQVYAGWIELLAANESGLSEAAIDDEYNKLVYESFPKALEKNNSADLKNIAGLIAKVKSQMAAGKSAKNAVSDAIDEILAELKAKKNITMTRQQWIVAFNESCV